MISVSTLSGFGRSGSVVSAVRELGEMGFTSLELAADAAAPDALTAATLCREKRLKCFSVAAPFGTVPWADGDPTRHLASPDDARRRRAVAAVLGSVAAAEEVQARAIVIRMGEMDLPGDEPDPAARRAVRDRYLDAAARSLFDLTRAVPEVVFSIRTPATWRGLPDPEELSLLFEDAGVSNAGYTHDVAAADRWARLGVADAASWLAIHGPRAVSAVLHDRSGDQCGLPPGGGEVDWSVVKAGLTASMIGVLEVGANHSAAEVLAGAAFLRDRGIAS